MPTYQVLWVPDFVNSNVAVAVPNATAVINEWAAAGWDLESVVPGTNTYSQGGLFVTLRRA